MVDPDSRAGRLRGDLAHRTMTMDVARLGESDGGTAAGERTQIDFVDALLQSSHIILSCLC